MAFSPAGCVAPAATASRMRTALLVSIEIGSLNCSHNFSMTRITRSNSSSADSKPRAPRSRRAKVVDQAALWTPFRKKSGRLDPSGILTPISAPEPITRDELLVDCAWMKGLVRRLSQSLTPNSDGPLQLRPSQSGRAARSDGNTLCSPRHSVVPGPLRPRRR